MSWLIDLVMGIPHLILIILVSYALGRGAVGVTVGVALTHWPSLTRVLRAEIMQLRAQPFMACSRALGISGMRMALTHAVPYVLPQYLVGLVLLFPMRSFMRRPSRFWGSVCRRSSRRLA